MLKLHARYLCAICLALLITKDLYAQPKSRFAIIEALQRQLLVPPKKTVEGFGIKSVWVNNGYNPISMTTPGLGQTTDGFTNNLSFGADIYRKGQFSFGVGGTYAESRMNIALPINGQRNSTTAGGFGYGNYQFNLPFAVSGNLALSAGYSSTAINGDGSTDSETPFVSESISLLKRIQDWAITGRFRSSQSWSGTDAYVSGTGAYIPKSDSRFAEIGIGGELARSFRIANSIIPLFSTAQLFAAGEHVINLTGAPAYDNSNKVGGGFRLFTVKGSGVTFTYSKTLDAKNIDTESVNGGIYYVF